MLHAQASTNFSRASTLTSIYIITENIPTSSSCTTQMLTISFFTWAPHIIIQYTQTWTENSSYTYQINTEQVISRYNNNKSIAIRTEHVWQPTESIKYNKYKNYSYINGQFSPLSFLQEVRYRWPPWLVITAITLRWTITKTVATLIATEYSWVWVTAL